MKPSDKFEIADLDIQSDAMASQVVICGGAFDPPHLAHREIAKKVLERTKAGRMVISPSGPRTDKAYKTAAHHRRRILELFVESFDDPRVTLDTSFLDDPTLGQTTTLGMDAHYSVKFGCRPLQIFGADVVPNMKIWDPAGRVEREVPKVLVVRNGKIPDISGLANFLLIDPELSRELSGLSSTEIRNRLKVENYEGLPEKVAEYIRATGAYRNQDR